MTDYAIGAPSNDKKSMKGDILRFPSLPVSFWSFPTLSGCPCPSLSSPETPRAQFPFDLGVGIKLVNGSRVRQVGPVDSCEQVGDLDPSSVNSRSLSRVGQVRPVDSCGQV